MWDKMVQNYVMRRDVLYVAGAGGLPMPQVGVLPREFFANISSEKGIIRQFLKAPGKKKAKKGSSQKLGKKGLCLQKKV